VSDELFSAKDLLHEMRNDIKALLTAHAQTGERLASGAKHFEEIDQELVKHDKDIQSILAKKCPRFPSPKIVYALLAIGFAALGFLVRI